MKLYILEDLSYGQMFERSTEESIPSTYQQFLPLFQICPVIYSLIVVT